MSWFDLKYLDTPQRASINGYNAFGDALMKLGAIGQNEKRLDEQKANEQWEKDFEINKFNKESEDSQRNYDLALKNAQDTKEYRDKELNIKHLEAQSTDRYRKGLLDVQRLEADALKRKEYRQTVDRAAKISAFKKIDPGLTKGLSDDEIYALGEILEKKYQANNTNKNQNLQEFENRYQNISKKYGQGRVAEIASMVNSAMSKGELNKKIVPVDAAFVEQFKDSGNVTWDDKGNFFTTPSFYLKTLDLEESNLAKEVKQKSEMQLDRATAKQPDKKDFFNKFKPTNVYDAPLNREPAHNFRFDKEMKRAWEQ